MIYGSSEVFLNVNAPRPLDSLKPQKASLSWSLDNGLMFRLTGRAAGWQGYSEIDQFSWMVNQEHHKTTSSFENFRRYEYHSTMPAHGAFNYITHKQIRCDIRCDAGADGHGLS